MFGTPVTDVRKEIQDRISAIDSEIGYNRKELADLRRRSAEKILGHQNQIEVLTNLRAGYADLLGDN